MNKNGLLLKGKKGGSSRPARGRWWRPRGGGEVLSTSAQWLGPVGTVKTWTKMVFLGGFSKQMKVEFKYMFMELKARIFSEVLDEF